MARGILAACCGMALLCTAPGAAQTTCRVDALGAEICVGSPSPSVRARPPFAPVPRGLAGVQAPVRERPARPALAPAWRTDALGNTFLTPRDLPPPRPPRGLEPRPECRRDGLGNLICR